MNGTVRRRCACSAASSIVSSSSYSVGRSRGIGAAGTARVSSGSSSPRAVRPQPQRLALLGSHRAAAAAAAWRRQSATPDPAARTSAAAAAARAAASSSRAALLDFAIQPEQRLLPVAPAGDGRQIIERQPGAQRASPRASPGPMPAAATAAGKRRRRRRCRAMAQLACSRWLLPTPAGPDSQYTPLAAPRCQQHAAVRPPQHWRRAQSCRIPRARAAAWPGATVSRRQFLHGCAARVQACATCSARRVNSRT